MPAPKRSFRLLPCAIDRVQAVEAETSHSFSRHTHEQFGIGVIHRGAQKSASGRGMVEAGPGTVITVNPGEVHDGAPIGDAGRSWRMLYLDPAIVAAAAEDMSEGSRNAREFSQPVIADERLARRFLRLFDIATRKRTDFLAIEEALALLLAGLLDQAGERLVPAAISRARALIDQDPAAPVTLDDLARVSDLGRFQLLRGFARATGLTPHAYLVQRRVDMARRLIDEGMALAEAAAASGFADQSHMTRIFVRKYGISPGVYAAAVS